MYKECFDSFKEKQLASPEQLQEAVLGNLAKKIAGIELGGNQDEKKTKLTDIFYNSLETDNINYHINSKSEFQNKLKDVEKLSINTKKHLNDINTQQRLSESKLDKTDIEKKIEEIDQFKKISFSKKLEETGRNL